MQNLTPGKLIPLAIGGLVTLVVLGLGGGWFVQTMWLNSIMDDSVSYGHKLPPVPPVKTKSLK